MTAIVVSTGSITTTTSMLDEIIISVFFIFRLGIFLWLFFAISVFR